MLRDYVFVHSFTLPFLTSTMVSELLTQQFVFVELSLSN